MPRNQPIEDAGTRGTLPEPMHNTFAIVVLFMYLVAGTGFMLTLRGVRGVMATLVIGWLFLPPAIGIDLPGLPQYTKEFAVSYSALLGVIFIEPDRIMGYRTSLIDLPVLIWMLSPFPASVSNDLGAYDGLSAVYGQVFAYGVPYFLGRIYIRTPGDVKTVAVWFVIAGLIATPMIIWEGRMSPQLNHDIYGYQATKFHVTKRLGGYRPMMFMRHGLEVGLWMATSGIVALWLWITAPKETRVFGFRIPGPAAVVLFAAIWCRSLGAMLLVIGHAGAALFVRSTGLRIVLIALVLFPTVYLGVRLSNIWSPTQLTAIVRSFDESRARSLEARLTQEMVVSEHALRRPIFGWGGHNRFRPGGIEGDAEAVDGWTTITLGKTGLVGLVSMMASVSLPGLVLLWRLSGREITSAIWAPSIALMLGVSIFAIDILLNAFPTPLNLMAVGVVASAAVQAPGWQRVIREHNRRAQAQGPSKPIEGVAAGTKPTGN